jgi:hypothetical protein
MPNPPLTLPHTGKAARAEESHVDEEPFQGYEELFHRKSLCIAPISMGVLLISVAPIRSAGPCYLPDHIHQRHDAA